MTTMTARCPQCQGANVEPRDNEWWCHDCNQSFPLAAVEDTPPDEKGEKKE